MIHDADGASYGLGLTPEQEQELARLTAKYGMPTPQVQTREVVRTTRSGLKYAEEPRLPAPSPPPRALPGWVIPAALAVGALLVLRR